MEWVERAAKLHMNEGMSWQQLVPFISREYGGEFTRDMIRNRVRRSKWYKRATDRDDICTVPQESGRVVQHNRGGRFKIAFVSDTHLNSDCCQLDHLNAFYDLCQREGVKDIYHCGDIDDGERVYRGQEYELECVGMGRHVENIIKRYPSRRGITTHFITGNHDLSYYKTCGADIGAIIASARPDMDYLGQLGVYVEFAPGIQLYLLHPTGAMGYAASYKIQRIVSNFMGDEKPKLMAVGHWHQSLYMFERNVHCLLVPCFQGQTPFLKTLGLMPKVGGWIVDMEIRNGSIERIQPEFVPFYVPTKRVMVC